MSGLTQFLTILCLKNSASIVWLFVAILDAILDIRAMILLHKRRLRGKIFLGHSVVQSGWWIVALIFSSLHYGPIGLSFLPPLIVYLCTLIYAVRVFQRTRHSLHSAPILINNPRRVERTQSSEAEAASREPGLAEQAYAEQLEAQTISFIIEVRICSEGC
jgi:hypothetical protein